MEELDIIIPDYDGNPIAFTERFSKFLEEDGREVVKRDIINGKMKNPQILEHVILDYLGEKANIKDDIHLFILVVCDVLEKVYLSEESNFETFRKKTLEAY